MRRRMHDGHPNRSALFDLKHDAGGMVDIEFAVQYLVLAHAHAHPALTRNAGNIALLRCRRDSGWCPPTWRPTSPTPTGLPPPQARRALTGRAHARVDPAPQASAVARPCTVVATRFPC